MNLLLTLISITLVANSVYAMIAPFFPIEAQKKGVSLPMIGCIIGIYSVAVIINSTIMGKVMLYVGRSNVTTIGLLFMGTSMIGFAFSHLIEDKNTFIAVTLVIRFCQGLASSSIQTSVYSMITIVYPDNMEKVIGYIEATMGVALVVGPLFGSVSFYFGGYQAPFLIIGCVFYIFVLFGRNNIKHLEKAIEVQKDTEQIRREILENHQDSGELLIDNEDAALVDAENISNVSHSISPKSNRSGDKEANKSKSSNNSKETVVFAKVPILTLLTYKQFVFAMMSGSLGYFIGSFVEPILALRLKDTYHFKDSVISLFFVIHFLGYLIFSPLVQYIPKRFEKRIIMMFGSFIAFVTLIFYGPSKMLNMPEDWHLMLIGLMLMGCAITFCLIPALPEMIRSVEQDFDNSRGEVNDVASGVFNTALGVGQVSGPLFGSLLTNKLGFRETTDLLSIYAILFCSVYFIFGNGWSAVLNIFKSQKQLDQEEKIKRAGTSHRSIEIEMNSSLMYKAPINDYFNRSLSDHSLSFIKKSWTK